MKYCEKIFHFYSDFTVQDNDEFYSPIIVNFPSKIALSYRYNPMKIAGVYHLCTLTGKLKGRLRYRS